MMLFPLCEWEGEKRGSLSPPIDPSPFRFPPAPAMVEGPEFRGWNDAARAMVWTPDIKASSTISSTPHLPHRHNLAPCPPPETPSFHANSLGATNVGIALLTRLPRLPPPDPLHQTSFYADSPGATHVGTALADPVLSTLHNGLRVLFGEDVGAGGTVCGIFSGGVSIRQLAGCF